MRTVIYLTLMTAIVATAWLTGPTVAKQTVSIDPISMMTNASNLPTEQFDLY
jgi:hypothetical protein